MSCSFLKKFRIYVVAATISAFGTSCSSDSEFPSEPNMEFIHTLARSTENATYKLSDWRNFKKPVEFNKWHEVDIKQYYGACAIIPGRIIFNGGKVWTPVDLFSVSGGPCEFFLPWEAYKKVTGQSDLKLYVSIDFEYDAEARTIRIDSYEYDVLKFEPAEIVLSFQCHYYGGEYHNGGESMDWYYMTPTTPIEIDQEKDLGFANKFEAYAYILKCARETFGDKIDLNEIYSPNTEFDYPEIDLVRLETVLEYLRQEAGL